MEECELCGKGINSVYVVIVESVELRVCADCAKGKHISYKEEERRSAKNASNANRKSGYIPIGRAKEEELELIDNYGEHIRKARESMGLPIKVFAEMINEKESLLRLIENQRTPPTIELIKKLERNLKIKLEQQQEEVNRSERFGKNPGRATLGEFNDK